VTAVLLFGYAFSDRPGELGVLRDRDGRGAPVGDSGVPMAVVLN
jgi:hypothetical protein